MFKVGDIVRYNPAWCSEGVQTHRSTKSIPAQIHFFICYLPYSFLSFVFPDLLTTALTSYETY